MPALPDVANVLKVRWHFTIPTEGGPVAHVGQHYRWTGSAPDATACAAIADDAMTQANTHLKENLHSIWRFESVDVTDLTSATAATGVSTHATIAGTNSGDALPVDTCTEVTYHLNRRYRGGHPKEFWPFGTQADMSNELEWTSGYLTQVNTDLAAFYSAFIGSTSGGCTVGARCNVSYYSGFTVHTGTTGRARNVPTTRSTPLVDDLQLIGANGFISVQRKRRGKV